MKKYKHWIALCLAVLLVFAAGCSAPASEDETSETQEEPSYTGSLEERTAAEYAQQQARLEEEWKAGFKDTSITTKTVAGYIFSPENTFEMNLAFLEAYEDVPFVDVTDFAEGIMTTVCVMFDPYYQLEAKEEEDTVILTRDNGSKAVFDFKENAVYFDNLSRFWKMSFKNADIDVLATAALNEAGEPEYFLRTENVFERTSSAIVIDMDKHFIPMLQCEGKNYIPLHTLNDLFFVNLTCNILYNGEELFVIAGGSHGELAEKYYSAEPGERSESMAFFNFCELCLSLDIYYGLSEVHNIDSFMDFFAEAGLKDDLLSTDGEVYTQALYKLAYGYLADKHTSVAASSRYVGADKKIDPFVKGNYSLELMDTLQSAEEYTAERDYAYPDGMPGYEEIGNTAYVTFDSFLAATQDYYNEPPTEDAPDTMGLIIYAHSRIMREESPIENVVIDLSNNGGGQADAAIYTIGWFLGSCSINFVDTVNGGQSSVQYMVDVNLDREFDEKDTLAGKNLYCIISPSSFSCGNLVPATFKSSGAVTLLGQPSGGGACVVMQGSTADGTLFNYSSNQRLSTVLNGVYSDVDSGVVPDVPITKTENFYDRELLTNYINGLL